MYEILFVTSLQNIPFLHDILYEKNLIVKLGMLDVIVNYVSKQGLQVRNQCVLIN